ncbi:class I SAM-dependent methyltransferase [Lysobacter cavernae]|uniref:Class I SAM-dependent methyltransferase n=1 Tax=Lysobacter cavernae TaxID=1685901 RepID=A0ABV7RPJ8_9GAMM
MSNLPLSGERVIEASYRDDPGRYAIYLLHVASYRFAEAYAKGKRVLDLGCGSGYGAAMMAEVATSVVAVDISEDAIRFASEQHAKPNLVHRVIRPDVPLPFEDGAFDTVLSFQVIEHVRDDVGYLAEARRVLRPGGALIVITPNRAVRLLPSQRPWNRWHLREYNAAGLARLFPTGGCTLDMRFMRAEGEIARVELARYRKLKWLTLPATLPVIPNVVRVSALNAMHAVSAAKPVAAKSTVEGGFGMDVDTISIGHDECDALNLVAIAHALL